jgi:hypothetical protein
MKQEIILITDNDINDIIAAYTIPKFLEVVNAEYYEANDFNGSKEYFNANFLDYAIDWFIETSDNLAIDKIELEGV